MFGKVFGRRKDDKGAAIPIVTPAANPKELKARLVKLRKDAASGEAQAQFDLACALQEGVPGHLPDPDGATALFEQAGNQVRLPRNSVGLTREYDHAATHRTPPCCWLPSH
jgi:hypothetical protein